MIGGMDDTALFKRKFCLIALAGALTVACQPSVSPSASGSLVPSVTDQASSTPGFSPTPTAGPISIVWADQTFSGIVTGVTEDQGQFVAVGATASSLASWTSSDGMAWTAHPGDYPNSGTTRTRSGICRLDQGSSRPGADDGEDGTF